jgi:hypothetical protein
MQPQEQISLSSAKSYELSVELLSLMQLLFFLALGYAVTKLATYLSRPPTKAEAFAKKIDDDQPLEDTPEIIRDEPQETSPLTKLKARHNNAQERKRQKKSKEAIKVQPCEVPDVKVADTARVVTPAPAEAEAKVVELKEAESPMEQHEQPEVDAATESKNNARVAKLMAKKSERKAKKALEKQKQEDSVVEGEQACQLDEPVVPVPLAGVQAEEKPIADEVEVKSEVEAEASDAQTTSSNSMVPQQIETVHCENEDALSMVVEPEEVPQQIETMYCDNEDALSMDGDRPEEPIETEDVKSDDGSVRVGSVEGISTPEVCLSPREMGSPIVWCGMPQPEFGTVCENVGFSQMIPPGGVIPQIEGWMPILVPAEHAPPGAFDGIWTNNAGERIVIEHSEITFDSGVQWAINMRSMTNISVDVEDEEFEAELDPETRCLKWSDGDVWTCVGQTENQQQWANVTQPDPDVPCLLWEGAQVTGEPFLMPPEMPPPPLNTQIPEDAENWEICWDWKKKGWCPRGIACDWYHPCQAQATGPNFCKPCIEENFDRPFADF